MKLNSHPQIGAINEPFSSNHWGEREFTFEAMSTEMRRIFVQYGGRKNHSRLGYNKCAGFKWMTNQHHNVDPVRMSAWISESRTKLIFLWRRSLLRQYISNTVMQSDKTATTRAHAASYAEAASIANVSVELTLGDYLVQDLDELVESRSNIAAHYAALPSMTVYYEDVVESSERHNKTWSNIIAFLGARRVELPVVTRNLIIHADKPILASVRNADAVRSSLREVCSTERGRRYGTSCGEIGWELPQLPLRRS